MNQPAIIPRSPMRIACVLLACAIASAAEGRQAERGLVVPELDLEVWVSTSLRLSEPHTRMYCDRLLDLARDLFAGKAKPGSKLARRPTWCVTLDHTGSIDLGTKAIVHKERGRVHRPGAARGGGEERRWVLPVRRRCRILFAIYKRVGDDYIARGRLSFREPPTWDEERFGGVPVASVVRRAGEPRPQCPITLEAAHAKALAALVPAQSRIRSELCRRLLDIRLVRLADVKGATLRRRRRLGLYVATLSVHNTTPWYIHTLEGKHFASAKGIDGLYCATLAFQGTLPPDRKQLIPCRAIDYDTDGEPPLGEISAIEWSLRGER